MEVITGAPKKVNFNPMGFKRHHKQLQRIQRHTHTYQSTNRDCNKPMKGKDLELLLNNLQDFKTLDLSQRGINSSECVSVLLTWLGSHHPERIIMDHCKITDGGAISLAEFFRGEITTKELYFRFNRFGKAAADAWAETLKVNSNLQTIDLLGNNLGDDINNLIESYMSSLSCRNICGLLPNNCSIVMHSLTHSDAALITANLEKNTDLKNIEIYGSSEMVGIENIISGLNGNRTLIRLKVTGLPCNSLVMTALVNGLTRNTTIKSLEIAFDSEISTSVDTRHHNSIISMFNGIERSRSLTSFRIQNLPPTVAVDKACCRLLQNNSGLLHMSIFNYEPNNETIDTICGGLSQNKSLRLLRLGGTIAAKLSPDTLRELGDAAMSRPDHIPFVVRYDFILPV